MKVGHVPLILIVDRARPTSVTRSQKSDDHGDAGAPIRAVLLARLGPNVWHDSPAKAMALLEEIEETARLTLLDGRVHEPLTEGQIDELRRTFGARW
jgi:ribulose-5-phosphate 4-epimerase/fuculose-1-phosphate aldolase